MIEEIDIEIPSENDDTIFDSICDPTHPRAIDFKLIQEAKERIKGEIQLTRCDRSRLSSEYDMELYFKKEFELPTGSFKERGACNTLKAFTPEQKISGAIAASTGNHASAMALHGTKLGIPVTVVMPTSAPLPKIKNCLAFGANVILKGSTINEARRVAIRISQQRGMTYINGYDHPYILAGQGTIGLEILEQVPNVDAIVVPIGGAGLIAGIAKAVKSVKPSVKIYGVESLLCPSFTNAIAANKPIYTPCDGTLADGLLVPIVGVNSFETAKDLIDKTVAIDEKYVVQAILKLIEMEKSVVEGAGAITLGALIANAFPELKGKTVVCLLCGGNIDAMLLGRVIDRALAIEHRIIQFSVDISDRIGGMSALTSHIRENGVCIREIMHERYWLHSDVYKVKVNCTVETKDDKHAHEFIKSLSSIYSSVIWAHEN